MSGVVIALAGRRVDAPGANPSRFPPSAVPAVRERIREHFEKHGATAIACSAACGADLLALSVAGELALQRRVVIPFDVARFRMTSVVDRGQAWGDVYDAVMRSLDATQLIQLGLEEGDEAYARTNEEILNEAARLAAGSQHVRAVIVWNGAPRDGGDLTLQFAELARSRDLPVDEVLTRPDRD